MPKLVIHNTLTRQKEEFKPIDQNHIGMYVCGPTVYDFAHLGNARPVVVFDVLYRLLKRLYPKVTYVRNITDIDDKIIAKAKESGKTIGEITTKTAKAYHEDMDALNALPPDIEPLCTESIPAMLDLIGILIAKNHAYEAKGHVMFNVPSMKDYGKLSRRSRDELVAGARVEVAPYKNDPADFVLWKPSTPDQPGWDSPWGRGRPGWHIECSAMSKEHLGKTFDIHGGGLDLIFPHHENEIAQSSCAHDGAPLANYWMHNGFLTINNDKMSKSLKNFFTVRELLATAPGEALRLALLSSQYRQPLDFSLDKLRSSKGILDYWYRALFNGNDLPIEPINKVIIEGMESTLCNDLNTAATITVLNAIASKILFYSGPNKEEKAAELEREVEKNAPDLKETLLTEKEITSALGMYTVSELKWALKTGAGMLGLLQQDPEAWFKWKPADNSGPTDEEIERKIALRLEARKAKNYAESDRIRDTLAKQGVILEDKAGGTTWRRK